MNQSVSSILSSEQNNEVDAPNYSQEECLARYRNINDSDPLIYESSELNETVKRINQRYIPYEEGVTDSVDREIITRIHGDAPIPRFYAILDSIALQNPPSEKVSTLFSVHAHNLNFETLQAIYDVSEKTGGRVRVIHTSNPNTAGAYYSWQIAMLHSKGKNIAMVDSDGYALPQWSQTMFSELEDDPTIEGVSGSMSKVDGSMSYNIAETIRPRITGPTFRGGNSAYNGDTARKFALENAGRLREDGSFAGTYLDHIKYIESPLVINSASKFSNISPIDVIKYGVNALARETGKRSANLVTQVRDSRRGGISYLETQAGIYAPWTKSIIEKYTSKSGIIRFEDIDDTLRSVLPPTNVSMNRLRETFMKITSDNEITHPNQFIRFLDEVGSQVYGPIIRAS